MTVGPALAAAGFLWYLLVREPLDFWVQVLPGLPLFSLGLAITVPPLTSAVLGAIPPAPAASHPPSTTPSRGSPASSRVGCLGLVLAGRLDTDGFHRVALVSALLMALGAARAWIGIRRPTRPPDPAAPRGGTPGPGSPAAGPA
ncbi:MAG: transporter [Naasia sp.]|nr:transporter [Naasia sp.]